MPTIYADRMTIEEHRELGTRFVRPVVKINCGKSPPLSAPDEVHRDPAQNAVDFPRETGVFAANRLAMLPAGHRVLFLDRIEHCVPTSRQIYRFTPDDITRPEPFGPSIQPLQEWMLAFFGGLFDQLAERGIAPSDGVNLILTQHEPGTSSHHRRAPNAKPHPGMRPWHLTPEERIDFMHWAQSDASRGFVMPRRLRDRTLDPELFGNLVRPRLERTDAGRRVIETVDIWTQWAGQMEGFVVNAGVYSVAATLDGQERLRRIKCANFGHDGRRSTGPNGWRGPAIFSGSHYCPSLYIKGDDPQQRQLRFQAAYEAIGFAHGAIPAIAADDFVGGGRFEHIDDLGREINRLALDRCSMLWRWDHNEATYPVERRHESWKRLDEQAAAVG